MASIGTLLLALAAWLFVPRADSAVEPTRPGLFAVLVDSSISAVRTRPAWGLWIRRQLLGAVEEAQRAGQELLLVEFAETPVVVYGPDPAADLESWLQGRAARTREATTYSPGEACKGTRGASELTLALQLVEAQLCAEGRADGRLLLLVDERVTGDDPRLTLEKLQRSGVQIERKRLPAPTLGNFSLQSLQLPARITQGAPLQVACELSWSAAASLEGQLSLEIDIAGPGGPWSEVRAVSAPRKLAARGAGRGSEHKGEFVNGAATWRVHLQLPAREAGRHRLRIRARLEEASGGGLLSRRDPIAEDDVLSASFRVAGSVVCGVLAAEPAASALNALVAARPQVFAGIQFVDAGTESLAPLLSQIDVLLTLDQRPSSLPSAPLRSFIQGGGAWLACGGWAFLNDWLPLSQLPVGDVQELLPLEPDPDDAKDRDVILLVDGSGSMAGEPFDAVREAVMQLSLGALPRDFIQLRFFSGSVGPVVFESHGEGLEERRAALAPLLRASVPGGSTDVLYSLEVLARLRRDAWNSGESQREGLIILISDGRSDWVPARSAEARSALSTAHTQLSVLAIGENIGYGLLQSLLLEGEELLEASDYSHLADMLNQVVNSDRVRREPGMIALLSDPAGLIEGGVGQAIAASALAALSPAGSRLSLGAVEILARSRVLAGAEVVWQSALGDPLLAVRGQGLGRVACLTGAPVGDWQASFLREQPGLFAGLLRSLAQPDRRQPELRVQFQDGQLVLDGAGEDWPALVRADLLLCGRPDLGSRRERRELVASRLLGIPPRQMVLADSQRRVGTAPGSVLSLAGSSDVLDGSAELRVEIKGPPGGPLAAETLGECSMIAPRPPEFRGPWAPVRLPDVPPAASGVRVGGVGRSMWALPALILGLALLFLSGLSGMGQALRSRRRHLGANSLTAPS